MYSSGTRGVGDGSMPKGHLSPMRLPGWGYPSSPGGILQSLPCVSDEDQVLVPAAAADAAIRVFCLG